MGDGLWVKVIINFRYCPGTAKVETSACSILYQVYPARQTCQLPLGKDSMTVCSDQELREHIKSSPFYVNDEEGPWLGGELTQMGTGGLLISSLRQFVYLSNLDLNG